MIQTKQIGRARVTRSLDTTREAALKMAAKPVQPTDDHKTALLESGDRAWARQV